MAKLSRETSRGGGFRPPPPGPFRVKERAYNIRTLRRAVEREYILLRDVSPLGTFNGEVYFEHFKYVDEEAFHTLRHVQPRQRTKQMPNLTVDISGNNNYCFFDAVSMALTGNESLALELHVRTYIEMVQEESFYMEWYGSSDIPFVSLKYAQVCINCAHDGRGVSAWVLAAAVSVIGKTIVSTLYVSTIEWTF